MDRKSTARRLNLLLPLLLTGGLVLGLPLQLAAQVPVDEYGEPLEALDPFDYTEPAGQALQPLDSAELEELVGPIALYPDDLLAIVLPASTYPLEIVQAARFLDELGTDSSLKPDESWDESVIALLNYPEIVYMMDKEIDWTWRLGEAVINQQPNVLAAVESFRDRAYAAGNLESDERQTVSNDDGVIEIAPVDEEIIYVPYYEPEEVILYQPRRVYHYYPRAYPIYYYPYPVGYSFSSGYFWGVTTAFTIGWSNRYLHVYHPSYWGHPYYGRYYHGHYYRRPSIAVYNNWYVHNSNRTERYRHRDGDHWRPRERSGARPETRRARNHHNPPDNARLTRSDNRQAHVERNFSRRDHGSRNDRSRPDSTANRGRQSTSGNRNRAAVANRNANGNAIHNANRRERDTEIRFGNRSNADTALVNRGGDPDRSNSVRRHRNTNSNHSQRRPVVRTSRQANANSRAQNRQVSQRNTPTRHAVDTRTSYRSSANQRPAVQRPASRPNVQRQAPAHRPASRPSVQRQSSGRSTSSSRRGASRDRDPR